MAGHEGVNPHTAADLLRQAMMQSSKRIDEDHDQLGSASSTPPGAYTPRPDMVDKRLPGIAHGYFGQVGKPRASLGNPTLPTAVLARHSSHRRKSSQSVNLLPTAPTPPNEERGAEDYPEPLLPHERLEQTDELSLYKHDYQDVYPTPPSSASTSIYKVQDDGAADEVDLRQGSSVRLLSVTDKASTSQAPLSQARRHTLAILKPLNSITTTPVVHAAHIENPALSSAEASSARYYDRSPSPGSSPLKKLKKLTKGATWPSPQQSTPPQTPRALSQENVVTSPNRTIPSVSQLSKPSTSPESSASAANAAAISPPKGKLSVTILQGRGLRPSFDPYVVCQFQWNEYISKGPRHDSQDAPRQGRRGREISGGMAIRKSGGDMGRPMAIPMRSRQSSHTSMSESKESQQNQHVTDPDWNHEAVFDVVGEHAEIDVSVYDRSNQEAFLGHVRFCPNLVHDEGPFEGWFHLEPREGEEDNITGELRLRVQFTTTDKKHYGPEDFEILKLIGKGTFGQVYQVRKKDTKRIYAMKVLSKKVIVKKKEIAHTLGERNILVRTAMADSSFIVGLKFSFQTPTDLYLVTDYMSGGELFWHLQREGRFVEPRAKFYIAELILALQHLHQHDIVYRDLKPENILLDANGHIALCDFGLSKANLTKNDTTNTFCGTTEYLAPEVLLDEHGYTKMVDFWSLGVLVFEMTCGWSPFYAEDTQQMYKNIAFGKVRFPRDALSTEGRNFVKGLLNRNPKHRLGAINDAEELKAHPFFADIDWDALAKKNVPPPFKPKLKSETDTSNFDPEFTNALNGASSLNARAMALASGIDTASTPLSPGVQANFKGFTFVDENNLDKHYADRSNDYDRMDEDEQDRGVEGANRGERMSGIERTVTNEDNIFQHGGFED